MTFIRLGYGYRLLVDRCGFISSSFVLFVWLYGHFIVFLPILQPHYKDGHVSPIVMSIYLILSVNTLFAYFRAMLTDPGKVANVPKEKVDWRTWEKCVRCCLPRPPRSHHCKRCEHCVLRMDHHCQWINNCVGEKNFWIFYMLLCYAFVFINLNIALYHFHRWGWLGTCVSCAEVTWIDPLSSHVKAFSYLIAALAFVGITLLLAVTNVNFSMGLTTIECKENFNENMQKAREKGRFIPSIAMLSEINGTSNVLLWFWPFRIWNRKDLDGDSFTV